MKKYGIPGLFFFIILLSISPLVIAQNSDAEDVLMLRDVPIFYGEEHLRKRLSDLPSGRSEPLGLLLSGGSARAFAHIGVLKRLEESGFAPDFIVTDSMGSIVGLLYGAGLAPDDILTLIQKIEMSRLFSPELPLRGGILNTSTFIELMEELLPYRDLRDLPIPVLVVCEDLRSKRTVVLAEGDFSTVLAASFALPVYFRPQEFRGHLLIDGGISNLVPVTVPYRYTDSVMVATTFYRKELNLNSPLTILNVAMDISKSRKGLTEIKTFDPYWIRCDVETYSFMDWGAMEEIVLRGYQSTDRILTGQPPGSSVGPAESFESRVSTGSSSATGSDTGSASEISPVFESDLEANSDTSFEPRVPTYLSELRRSSLALAEKGLEEYLRTGVVHTEPPLFGARAGIELDRNIYSRRYFGDRNRFSGGFYFKSGYGLIDARAFYQPEVLNQYQFPETSYTGLSLALNWMPARLLHMTGTADFNFTKSPDESSEWVFHSLSAGGSAFAPFRLGSSLLAGPVLHGEYRSDNRFEKTDVLMLSGLRIVSPGTNTPFNFELETAFFLDDSDRKALDAELIFEIPLIASFFFEQRIMTRLPLFSTSNVPYFPADYFRAIIDPETVNRLLVSNSFLAFEFSDWQPTFAETFILEAVEAGPFLDLRYTGAGQDFDFAAGMTIDADLSLIGLKPIELRLDCGYWGEGWFVTFSLGA